MGGATCMTGAFAPAVAAGRGGGGGAPNNSPRGWLNPRRSGSCSASVVLPDTTAALAAVSRATGFVLLRAGSYTTSTTVATTAPISSTLRTREFIVPYNFY